MSDGITMTNAVIECILSRSAAKYDDHAATLSDDQIRELVRIGTTAPTSFHLQNWRFILLGISCHGEHYTGGGRGTGFEPSPRSAM